ncbi:MAG: TPM domain-containing protein [Desulfoprunum sp.]
MTAIRRLLPGSLLLTVLLVCLHLQALPGLALEVPPLEGRVNDYAAMLAPATVDQLERSLAAFEQEQSTQIVVLTVASLSGDSLEDFSLRVAESWKIGRKGLDNGALLLIARDDRKIRIEVGYGLEGRLTDLAAGRIIRDVITPQFRNGSFDQGVINGVTVMMAAVKGEFSDEQIAAHRGDDQVGFEGLFVPLLVGLFFISRIIGRNRMVTASLGGIAAPVLGFLAFGARWLMLAALIPIGFVAGLLIAAVAGSAASGRTGRGTWSGGGFGGSSGGFGGGGFSGGGGGFGGGGASGGW